MRKSYLLITGTVVVVSVLLVSWLFSTPADSVRNLPTTAYADLPVPDFEEYEQVNDKKQAFFDYLKPVVEAQNDYIRIVRTKLSDWREKVKTNAEISDFERSEISFLREEYNVEEEMSVEGALQELLVKVDIVPVELVLIQSANESAWGTSRFAQEGYNFYGLWCFVENCGFVPKRRNEGASHEVAKFENLDRATYVYMRNLNRHPAYEGMRKIRNQLRKNDKDINGMRLAEGLVKYSERGHEYVEELQQMIRINEGLIAP